MSLNARRESSARFASIKRTIARACEIQVLGAALGKLFGDEIPAHGFRIQTGGLPAETKSQLFFRTYESSEIRAVERYLRCDLPVVELGAGIGVISCCIRQRLSRECRLYCVEPNAVAAELLRRNLKANRLDDNVTVLNAAVSYGPHDVGFVSGKSHLDGHIVHQEVGTIVEAVNLSNLLDRFGLPQCSLVCDIEGSELAMIAGDRPGLSRCRQLIIELHPTAIGDTMYSTEELASELSVSHGFRLAYRDGNVFVFERERSPSAECR